MVRLRGIALMIASGIFAGCAAPEAHYARIIDMHVTIPSGWRSIHVDRSSLVFKRSGSGLLAFDSDPGSTANNWSETMVRKVIERSHGHLIQFSSITLCGGNPARYMKIKNSNNGAWQIAEVVFTTYRGRFYSANYFYRADEASDEAQRSLRTLCPNATSN